MSHKLIIVSTRLPVSVSKVNNQLVYSSSTGGLATGVSTVSAKTDSIWIGWPGIDANELSAKEKQEVTRELKKRGCHPVFLATDEINDYYSGYCNATLWPLLHYFMSMTRYEKTFWESYKHANELFYTETKKFIQPSTQIWVHDYQLMLLPQLIRDKHKDALIGFFLHTPFPSFEIFRLLPERKQILTGLLGSDLIGFHTYDYVRHFLTSVERIVGYESRLGAIEIAGKFIQTDAFPIGIDYDKFAKTAKNRKVNALLSSFNIFQKNIKIILSVDRSDYSKGIPARLDAFELFLRQHPEYIEKIIMIVIAVPSRDDVDTYQDLRETIEQKVSRINGDFSTVDWSPITYRRQALPFNELTALYKMSDIMLVTPLRDGMNLVAKEYVATHHNSDGVLVLSEMAGVATELPESILVNPNDSQMVADAIVRAITMPIAEQKMRMKSMQQRLSTYTINRWAKDYIEELNNTRILHVNHPKKLNAKEEQLVVKEYKKANKRLLLLDYDGSIKDFVNSPKPSHALPTLKVRRLIKRLTSDPKNTVMIISGRPKNALLTFFDNPDLGLVAEHGGWVFDKNKWLQHKLTSKRWKKPVRSFLERYTARTPGSEVEEKDFGFVWHYRRVSPDLAYVRSEELKQEIKSLLVGTDIEVFDGQKIVEIKPKSMHKGAIVKELLSKDVWDFMLAIGDDYTDEDMFNALPILAHTVHVGNGDTDARYQLDTSKQVIELLSSLQ